MLFSPYPPNSSMSILFKQCIILYSRKELIIIRNTLTCKPRLPDYLFNAIKSLQLLKPPRGKGWKKRRKGVSRIAKQPHSTPGLSPSQRSTGSRPLSKQKQLSSALKNSHCLCNKSLDLNDVITRKDLIRSSFHYLDMA